MKKKKIISALIVVAVLLTAYLIIIGIQVREKEKREKEILLKRQALRTEGVLRDIQADGEVVIQDDKVVINDLEFNVMSLVTCTFYYNKKTGTEITPEQLIEQFYVYIINYEFDESTKELEDFCAFVEEEGAYGRGGGNYGNYFSKVGIILNEQNLTRTTATREQLEEACKEALEELGY